MEKYFIKFKEVEGVSKPFLFDKDNTEITEISPDAEWVTDGMKLVKDDVKFVYSLPVTISNPARLHIEMAEFPYVPTDEDVDDWSHNYFHTFGGRSTSWEITDVKISKALVRCPSSKKCFH